MSVFFFNYFEKTEKCNCKFKKFRFQNIKFNKLNLK